MESVSLDPKSTQSAAYLARNAVECLPEGGLDELVESAKKTKKSLRIKLGIDPTTADIHLGHTVVLRKLREFQDAGHTVVLIIGDFTARVGDPSGRSVTRPVISAEEIAENARTYKEQASKVLAFDERLEVRFNSEWLEMSVSKLFDLVRHVTVAQILERDDFSKRWAAREPISLLEMIYPVMQGYDSVAVESDVEIGGTDQTFNLLMGRAIQSAYGMRPQVVLTVPLLNGTDGARKMSKSFGNYIGITDTPEEMYGKTLSIPDATMASWYELLLGGTIPNGLSPRDAKRALARSLITRYYDVASAKNAEESFDRVFISHQLPETIEEITVEPSDGMVHLPLLITEAFGGSRSEARRQISQGAVKIDGDPIATDTLDLPIAELEGRVLQVGKRRFKRVRSK